MRFECSICIYQDLEKNFKKIIHISTFKNCCKHAANLKFEKFHLKMILKYKIINFVVFQIFNRPYLHRYQAH